MDTQDESGFTPFFAACGGGYVESARYLLEKGTNLKLESLRGQTALMAAAEAGDLALLEAVLQREPSQLNRLDRDGKNAFLYAAAKGHVALMKSLAAKGENPLQKTAWAMTALHLAGGSGKPEALDYLIGQGFSALDLDSEGKTPFYYLLESSGDVSLAAARLLQAGAELNQKDQDWE